MKRTLFTLFCLALLAVSALAQTAEIKKTDPEAWNLLKSTRETSKNFPSNFAGVTADVVLNDSGALKRSEAFTDEYKQVDGVWFPASRRVVRAENGKVITSAIEFHNPKIRFASEQASR